MSRRSTTHPQLILVDTSVRKRGRDPQVKQRFDAVVADDTAATCPVVTLELLFSARDRREAEDVEREEVDYRSIPLSRSVERAALGAVRELARRDGGYHRVSIPDVLIAAAAQEVGADVLHYDRHFDRLAKVLHFRSVWLAPAGSLS